MPRAVRSALPPPLAEGASVKASPATNRKGQRLGAKGDRMRQSLMDATARLLATKPPWSIKVADIAAACGVRAPNFYAYFDSVAEVILALAEQATSDRPDLESVINAEWTSVNAYARARRLAELSVEYWEKHRPVLRVVDMLADDGDPEFLDARIRRTRPVVRAFRARIVAAQQAGRLSASIDPRLCGYAMASQIERWGYYWKLTLSSGISRDQILDTLATLFLSLVAGLNIYPDVSRDALNTLESQR